MGDNWFDDPEPADAWTARVDRLVRERERAREGDVGEIDNWVEETAPALPRRDPARSRRLVVLTGLGVLGLCLLLGVLAAVGVFSGGTSRHTALTLTTPTTAKAPPTTTVVTTASPTITVPTTPLKPGDSGPPVDELQRALAKAGYSTGAVDGSYGPATKQAVAAFQRAHGLSADGVAGPLTLQALAAALQQATG